MSRATDDVPSASKLGSPWLPRRRASINCRLGWPVKGGFGRVTRISSLRIKKMKKQQAVPNYLPALDRQLEHQAGLPSPGTRDAAGNGPITPASRGWLGTDFTHVIVAR